ncbi:hypothetical protein EGK58_010155 [Acinetobacter variabilis]|uniref:hypothetical protein n=2 Tax=Acinetobacter TaxID=469 RepID=UPI000F690FF5|nr:hypothetical protein [Acinetobacter variabilis]QXR18465.1 hypothetical protein EGK58_010155 [Acinetobacter variabilis]
MTPFSIELAIEKIVDKNSKENFLEVYKCYEAGCYRAAVGLLWSVVVTDIVSKLQKVEIDFNDSTAHKLLTEIKEKQERKETDWEKSIVEDVHKRMKFFDQDTYENLLHLQKKRHLCSHPLVQETDNKLYTPTPEETKSFIRHALEDLLIVPAGFSRHALKDSILMDIDKLREAGLDIDAFKDVIQKRYIKHLPKEIVPILIKELWKFCFIKSDPKIDENRHFNAEFLFQIITHYPEQCKEIFQKEDYINKVTTDDNILYIYIALLSRFDFIYDLLDSSGRAIVSSYLTKHEKMKIYCPFLSKNISEHLKEFLPKANHETFKYLLKLSEKFSIKNEVMMLGIEEYGNSTSYDEADTNFNIYIEDYLIDYNFAMFQKYLEVSENNSQIYDRRKFYGSNNLVYKILFKKFAILMGYHEIDSKKFPKFFSNVDKANIEKQVKEEEKPEKDFLSALLSTADDLPF